MLTLKQIRKTYKTGTAEVRALDGISLSFRRSEFVSILGPSGCGKTTLLNVIGGLDRYDSGELTIGGRPTQAFRDSDWDTYRNHSVGFVFQSYYLIPHQTVLANVELALTLAGVSREERRTRALEALRKVGLEDQAGKRPNQLSGGQMQRVAIARALINDPEIVLADEPTGALDSETGIAVMELLRAIAKERLVIMVTHNPELAQSYSTRIIRLLDGKVIGDTNPYLGEENGTEPAKRVKKPSMKLGTALSLSFRNLLTKKGRTFMIALAGSIGIIGISLILALSTGVQNYIDDIESETMASYPVTITAETMDSAGLMTALANRSRNSAQEPEPGVVTSSTLLNDLMNLMLTQVSTNDLKAFLAEATADETFMSLVTEIRYDYGVTLNLYRERDDGAPLQVNPSTVMDRMMGGSAFSEMNAMRSASAMASMTGSYADAMNAFARLPGDGETLRSQYRLLAGAYPESYDELLLVVDRRQRMSDLTLHALGLRDPAELAGVMRAMMTGETYQTEPVSYTFDELLSLNFRMVVPGELYERDADGIWKNMAADGEAMRRIVGNGTRLRVVGIAMMQEDSLDSPLARGGIGYLPDLELYAIDRNNRSGVVTAQTEDPDVDVFTGLYFAGAAAAAGDARAASGLSDAQRAFLDTLEEEQRATLMAAYASQSAPVQTSSATYEEKCRLLAVKDLDHPSSVSLFPADFESKDALTQWIDRYNERMTEAGKKESVISYTDYVGLIMSSVTSIINAITYVLVAFVAISLIVSSIMIGIITYISVLERTREIGILRAIGASKRDISRVFNAETLAIGFFAGGIGVLISWLLTFPITALVVRLTGVENLAAVLPGRAALVLVVISMLLTLIAGLIPSRFAAKRDPVAALRTE